MLPAPVDLLDFWRGLITPRRLWLMIRHLPRESPFIQAIAPAAAWGPGEHLAADLNDMYAAVHSQGQAAPIKRPGQEERDASRREQRLAQFKQFAREREQQLSTGSGE